MANEHDQSEPRPSNAAETAASSANPHDGDATADGHDSPDRFVATLNAGVDRILRAFDEKIRYDETKQKAIDRQHEELLGYRADLVARAAGPFIYGMIHHHGEISRLVAAVRQETAAEMPSAKVCNLLESLQQDVEQVLGENGVTAYRAEAAEPFDPVRQTVVGRALPTDDEARSGTIAACLGPGFERDGKVIHKARVSAYRLQPPPAPVPPSSRGDGSETHPDTAAARPPTTKE